MKATARKRVSQAISSTESESSWSQFGAGLGAAAWASVAVLARAGTAPLGPIELIFLFAPLVIVPLGMELLGLDRRGRFDAIAQRVQPLCAALAVIALWLPPGRSAGILASGWMCLCLLLALSSPPNLFSFSQPLSADGLRLRLIGAIARLDLLVGGAWFLASRFGMHPFRSQEPMVLLTAVHFHFAGFATAVIAATMLRFARQHGLERWPKRLLPFVVGMPYVVAAGFLISPALKMAAGVVFSATVAALAIVLRYIAKHTESQSARFFLEIAAASVFAGMVLSAVYAIADFRGSNGFAIPQMARTHGLLNAVGFCLPALLGWLIEYSAEAEGEQVRR
jgi:hypothetical protein